MKVLVVMGTRPEAIKLAPVVKALRRKKGIKTLICATAQHRELLDQAMKMFKLKADFDLNLMRRDQTPADVAKRVIKALGPVLVKAKPDLVVVQGDTTTAAAAALCAAGNGVPVAHVEAGLRSFDLDNPFPEEINRIFIDSISSLVFPPTPDAKRNLIREKLHGRKMVLTGNTIVDALRAAEGGRSEAPSPYKEVLVTLHRREIHGRPYASICRALLRLAARHEDLLLVYPVHPSPAILKTARRLLRHPRIFLLPPQPYPKFLALLKRCSFVITDSGGVQEEAVCLRKPLLVMRAKTERPEVVSCGAGVLLGHDPRKLELWTGKLLKNPRLFRRMAGARNPYGDGRASARIAAAIADWLASKK